MLKTHVFRYCVPFLSPNLAVNANQKGVVVKQNFFVFTTFIVSTIWNYNKYKNQSIQ